MTNRHAVRWGALALLALSLGACATARRPDPQPIADTATPDAETLAPEFHGARVGHDALRGSLPSE
ncbi:MAG TPA: hypothetical protein VHC73_08995 [Vitreimonas sp.]|nr:hypothetical protein [Vitreimonas sp.]